MALLSSRRHSSREKDSMSFDQSLQRGDDKRFVIGANRLRSGRLTLRAFLSVFLNEIAHKFRKHSKSPARLQRSRTLRLLFLAAFVAIIVGLYIYFHTKMSALEVSMQQYALKPVATRQVESVDNNTLLTKTTKQTIEIPAGQDSIVPDFPLLGDFAITPVRAEEEIVKTELTENVEDPTNPSSSEKAIHSTNPIQDVLKETPVTVVEPVDNQQLNANSSSKNVVNLFKINKIKDLTHSQQLMQLAQTAFQVKNWAQASRYYLQVTQLSPDEVDAWLGLGASLLNQQAFAKAIQAYQSALSLDPDNLYALEGVASQLPMLLKKMGRTQGQVFLEKAIAVYPESAILLNALGTIQAFNQNWQQAQSLYFKALSLEASNALYHFNVAVSLDHLKQYQLAVDYYAKALTLKTATEHFDAVAVRQRMTSLKRYLKQRAS